MQIRIVVVIVALLSVLSCASQNSVRACFENPPNEYRPMPFWHLNGRLTKETIEEQITEARSLSGFGGVTVLPVSVQPKNLSETWPGTNPTFLSGDFFARYLDMLTVSRQQGSQVILYDDIDFPSGSAGGRLLKEYPEYVRKYLVKEELMVQSGTHISKIYAMNARSVFVAISAMNTSSLEILDMKPYLKGSCLEWDVPAGEWRIMYFSCQHDIDNVHAHVDYMQPEAVSKVMEMTYGEYDKHLSDYFGNVITKTFFDDVGFVGQENTWTPGISKIFEDKYGKNPALYYPALYYDIGPETQSARVAFYDIRSELMAGGYVKQVSQWAGKRHMSSMGHPPENYSPNTVVANGDVLKYYRHVQIPLLDAIFFYGRGMHGFKQISSAADLGDKPIVGAELCGAFHSDMDSLTLYRTVIDAMARGVNFVVPHGMWYDTRAEKIRIPPLISHQNPLLRDCLPNYSDFVGRCCLMLQGGKRVSEIALLWPIAAIQAESYINRDATSGLPVANWLPEHVNHHVLSDLLSNKVRQDFTFVHPEDLCNGKISIRGNELRLNNKVNSQCFKVLIMPGGDVISVSALKAIQRYYEAGGKIIATASLPFRAAEFGKDEEVRQIIKEIFELDDVKETPSGILFKTNGKGGQFAFISHVNATDLHQMLNRMGVCADVGFDKRAFSDNRVGYINYVHKQKKGNDLYFFTNTTESHVTTQITLRGRFRKLELWNPHTGLIKMVSDVRTTKLPGGGSVN